jgi:hypothetical protein
MAAGNVWRNSSLFRIRDVLTFAAMKQFFEILFHHG